MVIYGERIALRPMEERDTADIIRWRNTDFVRKNFIYQKPFTAETHHHWIETMVKTGKVVQFMICPYEADTENEAAQEEPGRQGQTADTGFKIIQNAVGSVYLRDIDETQNTGFSLEKKKLFRRAMVRRQHSSCCNMRLKPCTCTR